MAAFVERERKYDLPAGFDLPDLTRVGAVAGLGEPVVHELDATYLDTTDLRLARHRVTVRRRTGGDDEGWHVKVPGGAGERVEHRMPLDGDLPAALDLWVRALRRRSPLRPVARIRTTRREHPLRGADGRVLAVVAEDDVHAEVPGAEVPGGEVPGGEVPGGEVRGGEPKRWRELEVELVDGDLDVLSDVDRVLREAGARPADAPSKLARALGDRLPAQPTEPADATVAAVVGYARAQRDAMLALDPAVRQDEPEAVHDMRVAIRRLRSTLRTFRDLWEVGTVRDELRWIGQELGAARDGEVMLARLTEAVDAEPDELVVGPVAERIRSWLTADLETARARLLAALDSARYLALLDALDRLLDAPPAEVPGEALTSRARKALRRARRDLAAAGTDPELHEARKEFKRARYAVEALTPIGGKPAKRLTKRIRELQDLLGTHQDSVVTMALLRDYADRAHDLGDDTVTYGVLLAHQREAGQRVLRDLPRAARRVGRRKLRRWLS